MFEFLGRSKNKTERSATDPGPSTMPQTVQFSATQIEMVRMTLHGVLKVHGIPGTWISGEVVPVHVPGQGDALLLQLEIMHWHDALVLHAPAFQQALLDGLQRFDRHANQTHYLFTWKFSPNCGCPRKQLPEPGFWNASERVTLAPITAAVAQSMTEPSTVPPKVHFELPLRDDDDDDDGFAPTQLHDIR